MNGYGLSIRHKPIQGGFGTRHYNSVAGINAILIEIAKKNDRLDIDGYYAFGPISFSLTLLLVSLARPSGL
jgi:hypothetical protein